MKALELLIITMTIATMSCDRAVHSPHPQDAIRRYITAVREGDTEWIYEFAGEQEGTGMELAEFEEFFDLNHFEFHEQVDAFEYQLNRHDPFLNVHQQSQPATSFGKPTYTSGVWRLDQDGFERKSYSNPRTRRDTGPIVSGRSEEALRTPPVPPISGLDDATIPDVIPNDVD